MKRLLVTLIAALALAGCRKEPVAEAETKAAPPRIEGVIVIPPDSPKLRQIRAEPVRVERMPADEFTAPAKLEFNPNRVSRVVLPAPGRVAEVFVSFGDAVERGAPLLTIESPEADAAAAEYLRLELALTAARAELVAALRCVDAVVPGSALPPPPGAVDLTASHLQWRDELVQRIAAAADSEPASDHPA